MTQEFLAKKKGIADIVFLIDTSGSMQPCLDALKENIGVLVEHMTNPGPNEDAIVKDWRIKVCGYCDANSDSRNWWQEHAFTSDVAQARSDLATLVAAGGGDEPESLLDGLWKLAKMPAAPSRGAQADANTWRHHHDAARCVIVFTDASCHMVTASPEAGGAKFEDVAREVMAARLRLSLYCPEADCYDEITRIDKCDMVLVGSLTDAAVKMSEFSRNTENFQKTMRQLAKTISVSAVTPTL
jgi:hypothetical protein